MSNSTANNTTRANITLDERKARVEKAIQVLDLAISKNLSAEEASVQSGENKRFISNVVNRLLTVKAAEKLPRSLVNTLNIKRLQLRGGGQVKEKIYVTQLPMPEPVAKTRKTTGRKKAGDIYKFNELTQDGEVVVFNYNNPTELRKFTGAAKRFSLSNETFDLVVREMKNKQVGAWRQPKGTNPVPRKYNKKSTQ